MSILITGGAGFIGSHLTEALLAAGETVVVLDNFDSFYPRTLKERNLSGVVGHPDFTLVEGDIRDPEVLRGLPQEIDRVVHLAALAGVRPSIANPAAYADVNLNGVARVLEFAQHREIQKIVFGSSSSVYGNTTEVPFKETQFVGAPISPYAATKRAGELLCHAHHHVFGTGIICLRLFTVYGPRQRPDLAIHKFARLLKEGAAIPMFGDGSTERDYTHVSDITKGILGALAYLDKNPMAFETANLGEATTISLSQMIDTLATAMGVQAQIDPRPMQAGDVDRTFADVSKAGELFGYQPGVEFAEGIRDFVAWFNAQPPADQAEG